MKKEFVRLIEKKKSGSQAVYAGFVIERNKKEIRLICQGPDKSSSIKRDTFEIKDYEIVPETQERVKSFFEESLVEDHRKVIGLECDLDIAKLEQKRHQTLYDEVFK